MAEPEAEIKEYVSRRDEALLSLDRGKLIEVFKEAGVEVPENEKTFWSGVHMARLQVESFSEEVKAESLGWLHANGIVGGVI